MLSALVFLFPLGLYLFWPSCFWNVDGVACAAALELGNPAFFFHSNHLLYAFFGFFVWKGLLLPLGITRSLPALQLFTSLLSAVGLLGLYVAINKLTRERLTAFLVTASMTVAAIVWVWSVEPQVYPLGLIGLSWGTVLLLRPPSRAKYRDVGLLHALAILGHVLNFLWWIPLWYWIQKESNTTEGERNSYRRIHAACCLSIVLVIYALVMVFVIWPRHGSQGLAVWLKGSAGLSPDHRWQWHGVGIRAPLDWVWATLCFFWGSFWPYATRYTTIMTWILTGMSAGGITYLLQRSWRVRHNPLWMFSILWIVTYGIFLCTWEPFTLCYRLTDCVPFGILLALGLGTLMNFRLKIAWAAMVVLTTGILTFETLIKPMHDSNHNLLYGETVALAKGTPPNSIYFSGGGEEWIYLLYFTGRRAWNVASPASEIAFRRNNHQPVFVERRVIYGPNEPPWLKEHTWKPMEGGLPWMEMQ